jgi:protein-disulfide isomerase
MSEERLESSGSPPTEEVQPDDELLFRRKHLYSALLPLAFVAGLATGFLFWGRASTTAEGRAALGASEEDRETDQPAPIGPQPPQAANDQGSVRLEVSVDDDPSRGPEDAPITIVEFSDFACQFCQRFHQETFQDLLDAYPDKILFVYRDFPVVGGFEAAQAAECADEQGLFWEYHDLLFSGARGLNRSAYEQYAEELDLDIEEFSACLDEERYASEVSEDANYAVSLGANGTPTFFINGIPLVGAQPLGNFKQVIDRELAQ